MICKQCGNELAPGAKFCGVCGTPAEAAPQPVEEVAQPQYAQPVESEPAQPVYTQPVQQPEQPQYAQPVQPEPAQPVYAQPVQQPEQPRYAQPAQPQYAQPQYQPQQYDFAQPQYNAGMPMEDPVERSMSKSVLVFGILAISFAFIPYVNFLGIIFGAIALSKAKKYAASGYVLSGRAKTGKILGLVGLIAGIVCTLFWMIIIIAVIIGATSSYNNYYSSGYYYY
ncbi:MAG: zinc-ribbon domain-containing protein [Ruminococcus sp.]|nr:zinc-ribbon domain-containing protein [Ruminococcus sp.]